VQTAAGSELGKMMIRLARHKGVRTFNIVRRPEAVAALQELGGDLVVSSSGPGLLEQIRAAVGVTGVRYALDPVGGAVGSAVAAALGTDGHMLVYGSLSEEPISIHSRQLIAKRCRIEGFWLGHFMRRQSIPASLALFRSVTRLMRAGILTTEADTPMPAHAIREAIQRAEVPGRGGKILLSFDHDAEARK
jgi:NADPH:quinone reductase-like Zn-dependent oxidoreductase